MTVGGARTVLSVDECLARLRVEGQRLGEVAETTAFQAAVPGCPGWDVEALLRHIGDVHRWAATIVRDQVQDRLRRDFVGPDDREGLLTWYREGHAQLLDALSSASPVGSFWMWGPAPNALAFWTRRQAHETAIHRWDVEQAAGPPSPFPPGAAADGIDEWLMLAASRVKVPGGDGRTLRVAPSDVPDRWLVELHAEGIRVQRGGLAGDCRLRATASDLFAVLMNRHDGPGIAVEGDPRVLGAWRQFARF